MVKNKGNEYKLEIVQCNPSLVNLPCYWASKISQKSLNLNFHVCIGHSMLSIF